MEYDELKPGTGAYLDGKDMPAAEGIQDVICFSHLRWDFVFQRPQHLLTRWAKECRVFFFEEPVFGGFESNYISTVYNPANPNLIILTPHVKEGSSEHAVDLFLEESVQIVLQRNNIKNYMAWYITPMAIPFTSRLNPRITVYDCMDALSHFRGAHPDLLKNEALLIKKADVVFTGGNSLYEFKKHLHANIHPFASSIDQKHFASGIGKPDPVDQKHIPHPRIGFFGVIDERFDTELIDKLVQQMPDCHFVMLGPVVKIDPADLPRHENIHYLGQKSYTDLPLYLAHWDVAILPFARNESTRFISPTKTPEYLSAGIPVVSTSITDVINPYGVSRMVQIADTPEAFEEAIRKSFRMKKSLKWQVKVRDHLKTNSWDLTWGKMKQVIMDTLEKKEKGAGVKSVKEQPSVQ